MLCSATEEARQINAERMKSSRFIPHPQYYDITLKEEGIQKDL
jgi:hypothetical protein